MNTSHLIWIERLILEEKDLLYNGSLTNQLLQYHRSRLIETTVAIKQEFLIKFEKLTDDNKALKPAIGVLQNKLTHYQNLLYEGNPDYWKQDPDKRIRLLAEVVNERLIEMHHFIEEFFPDSFDHQTPVSKIALHNLQAQVAAQIYFLKKTYPSLLDEPIFQLTLSPLERILHLKNKTISLARQHYLESFCKDLEDLPSTSNKSEALEKIRLALLRDNLNSAKAFQFLSGEISQAMKSMATLDQKIYYLFEQLRYFNGINTCKRLIYNPKAKPIIQQIIDWIVDEVKYLKKELDFKKDMQLLIGDTPTAPIKLKTQLSVGELSLLARLFVETNLIEMEQVVDIIRWLSASVESKNTRNISEKSLRKKFYDPDLSSRSKVEGHLQELSDHLKNLP